MVNLTSKEASELARHYAGLASAATSYRFEHWDKLTDVKRKLMSDQTSELLKQSDEYVKQAASLIMNDVKEDLEKIKSVTEEIEKTLLKIASVQKAINVLAAALDLGAAILSRNPLIILKEIGQLKKSWTAVKKIVS